MIIVVLRWAFGEYVKCIYYWLKSNNYIDLEYPNLNTLLLNYLLKLYLITIYNKNTK